MFMLFISIMFFIFKFNRLIFILISLEFLVLSIFFNFLFFMFMIYLFLLFSVVSSIFGMILFLGLINFMGNDFSKFMLLG